MLAITIGNQFHVYFHLYLGEKMIGATAVTVAEATTKFVAILVSDRHF